MDNDMENTTYQVQGGQDKVDISEEEEALIVYGHLF